MIKNVLKIFFLSVLFILLSFQNSTTQTQVPNIKTQQGIEAQVVSKVAKVNLDYGKIPLYFIPNQGQVNEKALFYAKTSRYTLWLTKEGLVFDSMRRTKKTNPKSTISLPKGVNHLEDVVHDRDVSRLIFLASNKNPEVIPLDTTEHRVNYFIGNEESKWKTDISTSKSVLYKELYKNIDLKVYGNEREIEYDFIIKPGGEVSDISLKYKDVKKTKINEQGNLVIQTDFGELQHAKPVCYQLIEEKKIDVEAMFKEIDKHTYRFKVRKYDNDYDLIIDHLVLAYSTYLGGLDCDTGESIAVDKKGAAYVTGDTHSDNFPTKNAFQSNSGGNRDAFITKINPEGNELLYSTYLGGSFGDYGQGIAVDKNGAAYVTGDTSSSDFPIVDAFQSNYSGNCDAFIAKISPAGNALLYSTYLGGSIGDEGHAIAVNKKGAAYVVGSTGSSNLPTKRPIQESFAGYLDAFITKIKSK